VLYEVMTHCIPFFEQHNDIQVFSLIISGHVPVWPRELQGESLPQLTLGFRNLCQKCWFAIPEDRPSMRDVCWLLRDMARQPSFSKSTQLERFPMTLEETPVTSVANASFSVISGTTSNEHKKFNSRKEFKLAAVDTARPPIPRVAGGNDKDWSPPSTHGSYYTPHSGSVQPRNRLVCDICTLSRRYCISGGRPCIHCMTLRSANLKGDYLDSQSGGHV